MIRKMLQAILCVILCPLLVAQDARPGPVPGIGAVTEAKALPVAVTIPKGIRIELRALERVTSETAVTGSSVQFAVAKILVVDGVTVLDAGAPVTGTVVKAKRGIANRQWAELEIQVKEVKIGKGAVLRLSTYYSGPRPRQTKREHLRDAGTCVALLPLCIASAFGATEDGTEKPNAKSGEQDVLQSCTAQYFWTASSTTVLTANLAHEDVAAPATSQNCLASN
jgi:hypothetical protein